MEHILLGIHESFKLGIYAPKEGLNRLKEEIKSTNTLFWRHILSPSTPAKKKKKILQKYRPHNSEPQLSDEVDTLAGIPLQTSTPHERADFQPQRI
ncbi:hypothetical protein TNCV_1755581 [Trichonephila clavipes]|nr:hypothetical protein TNCV_1755581 [Trichonephila clavipes]